MREPVEHSVRLEGLPGAPACRVWEKGDGEPLGVLAGLGGWPRWTPFLDALAQQRRVVVPSLPGFPGAGGHEVLDDVLDWVVATLDLLEAAELGGRDLVGLSVGGALAAEVAALAPGFVRRLALAAPFGLYDADEPGEDVFAQRPGELPALLCRHPERWHELHAAPAGADPVEWALVQTRAQEAAARLLWPLGDTRLPRRLHRVRCPVLLLWGAHDRVVPPGTAKRMAALLGGASEIASLEDAGHAVDLDAPEAAASRLLAFFGNGG